MILRVPRILRAFFAYTYTAGIMTSIKQTLHLDCPYVRAKAYLHDALQAAALSRTPQLLHLSASLPGTGIELEKGVRVSYQPTVDPFHFDEPWIVDWTPEPGGRYPSFRGTLTVRADEDYTGAILELEGSYAPPMGAMGQVFDAALGRRIAGSTMRRLLSSIGDEMTSRYEREEAAKVAR